MMPHAMAYASCAGSMIADRRCGRRPKTPMGSSTSEHHLPPRRPIGAGGLSHPQAHEGGCDPGTRVGGPRRRACRRADLPALRPRGGAVWSRQSAVIDHHRAMLAYCLEESPRVRPMLERELPKAYRWSHGQVMRRRYMSLAPRRAARRALVAALRPRHGCREPTRGAWAIVARPVEHVDDDGGGADRSCAGDDHHGRDGPAGGAAEFSLSHRGQVSVRLRAVGSMPPLVDDMAWVRQGRPSAEWPVVGPATRRTSGSTGRAISNLLTLGVGRAPVNRQRSASSVLREP